MKFDLERFKNGEAAYDRVGNRWEFVCISKATPRLMLAWNSTVQSAPTMFFDEDGEIERLDFSQPHSSDLVAMEFGKVSGATEYFKMDEAISNG